MSEQSLEVGSRAPDFKLESSAGDFVELSKLQGSQVVLYFYPRDDTPGCTKEACSFRDNQSKFKKASAVVLGVSGDDSTSHNRFIEKFELNFALLSDPDAATCKAYGVYKSKSLYGRSFMGIERTTFIIDEQGIIQNIFPKVKVDGHTKEVLKALTDRAKGSPEERKEKRSRFSRK